MAFKGIVGSQTQSQTCIDQSDERLDCYILSPCFFEKGNKVNILGEMSMSDVLYIYLFIDIEFIKSSV